MNEPKKISIFTNDKQPFKMVLVINNETVTAKTVQFSFYNFLIKKELLKLNSLEYKDTHRGIIEGCKAGNRSAQYQLYQLYSRGMYNICLRMLNNGTDAEDLLQNSFIDVFTKLHYFRYESSIGAWIKRIVINNCINFLNKKRIQWVEMGERDLADVVEEEPSWDNMDLSIHKVNEGIRQLPEGYRVVLSLYLLEGYDHKEISEILGISASTSKSQYSRAKKKLRGIVNVSPTKLNANL